MPTLEIFQTKYQVCMLQRSDANKKIPPNQEGFVYSTTRSERKLLCVIAWTKQNESWATEICGRNGGTVEWGRTAPNTLSRLTPVHCSAVPSTNCRSPFVLFGTIHNHAITQSSFISLLFVECTKPLWFGSIFRGFGAWNRESLRLCAERFASLISRAGNVHVDHLFWLFPALYLLTSMELTVGLCVLLGSGVL